MFTLPLAGCWSFSWPTLSRPSGVVRCIKSCWPTVCKVKVKSLSCVWLFATTWTVAHQVPPSMGFSRQEYWSELPFPSPGDLPNPGIKARSPSLQADDLWSEPPWKPCKIVSIYRSFISLGRFIPKYFILFTAVVNEIVSLISLSVFSLLVYRNARDFCVLILYPATIHWLALIIFWWSL